MKRFLITVSLMLFAAIAAMALSGAFRGVSSSDDAEFAPISMTVMVLSEYEAIIPSTGDIEVADPVIAMVLCSHEARADTIYTTYLVGEVEIMPTAELLGLMNFMSASELSIIVMIGPALRTQSRQYEQREMLKPAEHVRPVVAFIDNARIVDTIGLRYRQ